MFDGEEERTAEFMQRLLTFEPCLVEFTVTKTEFACAGFEYSRDNNSLACDHCKIKLIDYTDYVDPLAIHLAVSQKRNCKFVENYNRRKQQGLLAEMLDYI